MATKPVISYQASLVPFALDSTAAIVRHKLDKTSYENWADKSALTSFVDSLYVPPISDSYLYVVCGCSATYDYVNSAAVPATDTTCSCGRTIFAYGN